MSRKPAASGSGAEQKVQGFERLLRGTLGPRPSDGWNGNDRAGERKKDNGVLAERRTQTAGRSAWSVLEEAGSTHEGRLGIQGHGVVAEVIFWKIKIIRTIEDILNIGNDDFILGVSENSISIWLKMLLFLTLSNLLAHFSQTIYSMNPALRSFAPFKNCYSWSATGKAQTPKLVRYFFYFFSSNFIFNIYSLTFGHFCCLWKTFWTFHTLPLLIESQPTYADRFLLLLPLLLLVLLDRTQRLETLQC